MPATPTGLLQGSPRTGSCYIKRFQIWARLCRLLLFECTCSVATMLSWTLLLMGSWLYVSAKKILRQPHHTAISMHVATMSVTNVSLVELNDTVHSSLIPRQFLPPPRACVHTVKCPWGVIIELRYLSCNWKAAVGPNTQFGDSHNVSCRLRGYYSRV